MESPEKKKKIESKIEYPCPKCKLTGVIKDKKHPSSQCPPRDRPETTQDIWNNLKSERYVKDSDNISNYPYIHRYCIQLLTTELSGANSRNVDTTNEEITVSESRDTLLAAATVSSLPSSNGVVGDEETTEEKTGECDQASAAAKETVSSEVKDILDFADEQNLSEPMQYAESLTTEKKNRYTGCCYPTCDENIRLKICKSYEYPATHAIPVTPAITKRIKELNLDYNPDYQYIHKTCRKKLYQETKHEEANNPGDHQSDEETDLHEDAYSYPTDVCPMCRVVCTVADKNITEDVKIELSYLEKENTDSSAIHNHCYSDLRKQLTENPKRLHKIINKRASNKIRSIFTDKISKEVILRSTLLEMYRDEVNSLCEEYNTKEFDGEKFFSGDILECIKDINARHADEHYIKTSVYKRSHMYYSKDCDLVKLVHMQQLTDRKEDNVSCSQDEFIKLPPHHVNEKTELHHAAKFLKECMVKSNDICEIYARYPLLRSTVTMRDLMEGKVVRVVDKSGKEHRVKVAPLPNALFNFIAVLIAKPKSEILSRFKEGNFDWDGDTFTSLGEKDFPKTRKSAVINIVSTLLHLYNQRNTYPWPTVLLELMKSSSKTQRCDILHDLGLIPDPKMYYSLHLKTLAGLQIKALDDGEPLGYHKGATCTIHPDNKSFRHPHSSTVKYCEYLGTSVQQAQPSNKDLPLVPSQITTEETFEDFLAEYTNSVTPEGSQDVEMRQIVIGEDENHETPSLLNSSPCDVPRLEMSQSSQEILPTPTGTPVVHQRESRLKLLVEPKRRKAIPEANEEIFAEEPRRDPELSDFVIEPGTTDEKRLIDYQAQVAVHNILRMRGSCFDEKSETHVQVIPSLRDDLKLQYTLLEESAVIFLSLIKGKPEDPQVLLEMLEDVRTFMIKQKLPYVMMTADAAELEILYKLKDIHTDLFSNIYLFWGIWHAHLNYMIQFYGNYRDAGIKLMLDTVLTPGKVDSILNVKSCWKLSREKALLIYEALQRYEWEVFLESTEYLAIKDELKRLDGYIDNLMDIIAAVRERSKKKSKADTITQPVEQEIHNSDTGSNSPMLPLHDISSTQSTGSVLDTNDFTQDSSDTDLTDTQSYSYSEEMGASTVQSCTESQALADEAVGSKESLEPELTEMDECNIEEELINNTEYVTIKEELHSMYKNVLLPKLQEFRDRGCREDKTFGLYSAMLTDLEPIVIGYLAIRFNDWDGYMVFTKMLYERVHGSSQGRYKHIIRRVLYDTLTWNESLLNHMKASPGCNITAGRGKSRGRDEMHEATMNIFLALMMPRHETDINEQTITHSAVHLAQQRFHYMKEFFGSHSERDGMQMKSQTNNDEQTVQAFLKVLREQKSFCIENRTDLIQPGTTDIVTDAELEDDVLHRKSKSREITVALVKEQTLKGIKGGDTTHYKRRPLKRFPPLDAKKKKRLPKPSAIARERKKDTDKLQKVLSAMLVNGDNPMEPSLVTNIVFSARPRLFYNSDGSPYMQQGKSRFKAQLFKHYPNHRRERREIRNLFGFNENSATIFDGMPLIYNTAPTKTTCKNFGEYSEKYIRKVKTEHLTSDEVYICFDKKDERQHNLKWETQNKRDSSCVPVESIEEIKDGTPIPDYPSWRDFLGNRSI